MKKLILILVSGVSPLFCQSTSGELHLRLTDPLGRGVKAAILLTSTASHYRNSFTSSDDGRLQVQRLPFGIYQIEIRQPGFAPASAPIEIHSSVPTELTLQLPLSSVQETLTVKAPDTLIDPDQAGYVSQIGADTIQNRTRSVPCRSCRTLGELAARLAL